ncbi:hypothetical protein CEXT_40891 [Caerostris extrusa]|uniref:Uncharacterized protein n=1 Tax=Caerostris extrusa TaxID=172846 RepID=A0AAV4WAN4_CAEEX|nr:hypothetical protein CEXT_40891 [Caerostris extrusa]
MTLSQVDSILCEEPENRRKTTFRHLEQFDLLLRRTPLGCHPHNMREVPRLYRSFIMKGINSHQDPENYSQAVRSRCQTLEPENKAKDHILHLEKLTFYYGGSHSGMSKSSLKCVSSFRLYRSFIMKGSDSHPELSGYLKVMLSGRRISENPEHYSQAVRSRSFLSQVNQFFKAILD